MHFTNLSVQSMDKTRWNEIPHGVSPPPLPLTSSVFCESKWSGVDTCCNNVGAAYKRCYCSFTPATAAMNHPRYPSFLWERKGEGLTPQRWVVFSPPAKVKSFPAWRNARIHLFLLVIISCVLRKSESWRRWRHALMNTHLSYAFCLQGHFLSFFSSSAKHDYYLCWLIPYRFVTDGHACIVGVFSSPGWQIHVQPDSVFYVSIDVPCVFRSLRPQSVGRNKTKHIQSYSYIISLSIIIF